MISKPGLAQDQQQGQQQGQQQQIIIPPRPPGRNPAQRYEIDAKRMGTDMNSNDALPRSREFIRIDSSYYVGWLYEGAYKFNHAADYQGFRNACTPLERALSVMERDYRRDLATRSQELINYYPVYARHQDYNIIVYYLNQCYLNSDQPDKAFSLCRRFLKWNFQRELFDAYNYMMWVTHRNRFYNSKKYAFLKNSIDENERAANAYLDSALRRIAINKRFNARIFQPGYEKNDIMGVYHYKSMLYAYAFKIDSANYYFNQLRNSIGFPHNNYATFRAVCADFREAEKEYKIAASTDATDKRLQEWAYYLSLIYTYKGYPKTGELLMKDMILAAGSTPGYGWYNIALARCLFYDGQVSESERYIEKAAEFKETHIGTTLGQSHYDFSIQLNKLLNKNGRYEMKRFEHKNWWYNPSVLASLASLKSDRYLQEFLIINQFSQNPERDRVIYKLLSTESTVSWDEIWYLMHNFGSRFFLKRFKEEAATDPRKGVKKYFNLFMARLQIQEGEYKEGKTMLDAVTADKNYDAEYEVLFRARVLQAYAEAYDGMDKQNEKNGYLYQLYSLYPQLIPFTGLQMNMKLNIIGAPDQEMVDRLKSCNINWTNTDVSAPKAYLSFSTKAGIKLAEYYVMDAAGNYVIPRQAFSYKSSTGAGVSLAYRLFGIGGKIKK